MLDSLTTSRHSLFETASSNLSTLNTKLESIVSVIPVTGSSHPSKDLTPDEADDEDASSTTSDPTELFHRDTGTQTTPQLSRSSTSSINSSDPGTRTMSTTLKAHLPRLSIIHSHLSELLTDNTNLSETDDQVRDRLNDLQTYLEGLAYGSSTYVNGYGGTGAALVEPKDDEITRVKAEIRGVKGVLLSARNFPGGMGRGRVGS